MTEFVDEAPKLDKATIFRQPAEGDPRKPLWDTMVAAERKWGTLQHNFNIQPDKVSLPELFATEDQVKKLHRDYYGQEVLDALAAGKL